MSRQDKTTSFSIPGNKLVLAGTIIIIAVIFFLAGIFFATGTTDRSPVVPPDDCGKMAILYMNTNLAQPNSTATLMSVTEKNGVYQIAARYQARNISLFATKDCSRLFTGSYTLKGDSPSTTASSPRVTPSPTPVPEPVKSSQPSTELFVMSFCPYGVQAENAMEPVVGLLGTKANITIRYIASVNGTTTDSVKSLHGPTEAKEDLRQLCIARYYPQELWPYLMDFNRNCQNVSLRQNATSLDACGTNTTRKLGINDEKIETCAMGSEGLSLLRSDEWITKNYKVTGSPTLIINGQRYSGQRTPEAFKQFMCARFETQPSECSVNLSAQAATASSGNC
jgi:glutaredoxin